MDPAQQFHIENDESLHEQRLPPAVPYKVYNKCADMFSLAGDGYSKLVWLQPAGGSDATECDCDDAVDHIVRMSQCICELRRLAINDVTPHLDVILEKFSLNLTRPLFAIRCAVYDNHSPFGETTMAKKAAAKKTECKSSPLKTGKNGKPLPAFLQGDAAPKKAMKKSAKGK